MGTTFDRCCLDLKRQHQQGRGIGGVVPLSEEELRLLEQMERALSEEDPKFASTLRGTSFKRAARRKAVLAGIAFLAGVAVLMTGVIIPVIPLGIRPETVTLANGEGHSCLDAVIDVLEPTGADTMAVASVHGHPVTARLKPGVVRDVGHPVRLAVDMSRASLFDPATELRIA